MNATTQISEVTFPPYTLTGGVAYRELNFQDEIGDDAEFRLKGEPDDSWSPYKPEGYTHVPSLDPKYGDIRHRLAPTPDNYRAMQAAWLSHFNVGVGSRVRCINDVDTVWNSLGFTAEFPRGVSVIEFHSKCQWPELVVTGIEPNGIRCKDCSWLFPFHVLAPVEEQPKVDPKPVSISKSEDKRLTTLGIDFVPSGLCKPGELDAYAPHPPAVPEGQGEDFAGWAEGLGIFFENGQFWRSLTEGDVVSLGDKSQCGPNGEWAPATKYVGYHTTDMSGPSYRRPISRDAAYQRLLEKMHEPSGLGGFVDCWVHPITGAETFKSATATSWLDAEFAVPASPTPAIERGEDFMEAQMREAAEKWMSQPVPNWYVQVQVNGQAILCISEQHLAGKEDMSDEERACVRAAADNLIGFIGKPTPTPSTRLLRCDTCHSPRSVSPCHKCGSPLREACDGWEEPRLPSIDRIRELAKEVGYAVGAHGSLERDLDLIAMPWGDGAVDPKSLAQHIAAGLPGTVIAEEQKPLGRWSCNIQANGYFKLIDLSVAPSVPTPTPSAGQEDRPKRRVFESVGVRQLEHDDFAEDPWGGMGTCWGSKIEHDPTVCEVFRELSQEEIAAEASETSSLRQDRDRLVRERDSGVSESDPRTCNHGFVDLTPSDLEGLQSELTRLRGEVERLTGELAEAKKDWENACQALDDNWVGHDQLNFARKALEAVQSYGSRGRTEGDHPVDVSYLVDEACKMLQNLDLRDIEGELQRELDEEQEAFNELAKVCGVTPEPGEDAGAIIEACQEKLGEMKARLECLDIDHRTMRFSLERIIKCEAPFNRDPLKFANNVIESHVEIARQTLADSVADRRANENQT